MRNIKIKAFDYNYRLCCIFMGVFLYRDCGILIWIPAPFPIPSRTIIPSRSRFFRDPGWGLVINYQKRTLQFLAFYERFCCFWSRIFSLQKHGKECYTHVSSSLEAHSTLFSQENLSQKPLLASPRSLLKQFSLLYFYATSQIYPWDWSSSFSFASTT